MTTLGNENLCADSELTKRRAYLIKSRLDELGHKLPLTHAYEVLAASCGYRNWPTTKAQVEPDTVGNKRSERDELLPAGVSFGFSSKGAGMKMQTRSEPTIDLVYAPPGYGKSTVVNAMNYDTIRNTFDTTGNLPEFVIVDVGRSSEGLAAYLQEALPSRFRNRVGYHRFKNTKAFGVNPFDTHLGFRTPTKQQRGTLVGFLMAMASDEKGLANDDLGRRIGQNIVDALYAQYSDHEAASIPKVFRAAADSYLMKEIARHGIDAKEGKTAWWSIVDEFATRKLFAQAKMAQRHAMPTITDLSSMMWQDQFSLARFGTDSAGMAQCLRSMADAIKRYMPVIADITRFDKGGAHVVVADLVDLQVHGGGIAAKLFELAYLGIAHSLYRDFFLTENDIEGLPDVFGAFHSPRILEARNSVRQISLDEMHRAATSHPAKEAFLRDAYSAKDVGAGFRLASQDLEAFHPRLAAEASNIVVLGCSPNNLENMNKLGLTPDGALEASRLHGPEKLSKTMIVRSQHDGIEDTVTITASPAAVWMTASSWVERDLREGATRRLGAVEALKILADEFPTGTATSRVEADAMRIARNDPHKRFEDAVKDIIEGLVADMAALST